MKPADRDFLRQIVVYLACEKGSGGEAEPEALKAQVEAARSLILHACDLMTTEQVGQWAGVREWLERDSDSYVPQPEGKQE